MAFNPLRLRTRRKKKVRQKRNGKEKYKTDSNLDVFSWWGTWKEPLKDTKTRHYLASTLDQVARCACIKWRFFPYMLISVNIASIHFFFHWSRFSVWISRASRVAELPSSWLLLYIAAEIFLCLLRIFSHIFPRFYRSTPPPPTHFSSVNYQGVAALPSSDLTCAGLPPFPWCPWGVVAPA